MPRIYNWMDGVDRARQRPSEEGDGQARPSQAYLDSISPLDETAVATDFGAGRVIQVSHLAMGLRSWLRYMPEEGSAAVLTQRSETAAPEILYYSNSKASVKVRAYLEKKGHYRPLQPGEFELSSKGFAQVYASKRGSLHLRGGVVTGWLSQDQQEVGFRGATHRRLLHDYHHDSALSGEERFGVVWRKGGTHDKRLYVRKGGDFAREYTRNLRFSGSPRDLVKYQEGHVIDEFGEEVLSPIRTPLRVYGRWFNKNGNGSLTQSVDEQGNVWWRTPDTADTGWTFQIPAGNMRMEVGEKVQIGARSDIELTGRHMTISARGRMIIRAAVSVIIESDGAIELTAPNVKIKGRNVLDNREQVI